jgi:hypothetical protein
MLLFLPKHLLFSEQFGHILPLTKLSDDVEIVLSLEDIEQSQQVVRVSHLDSLQDIDFIIHELLAEFIFLPQINDFDGHYLILLKGLILLRSFFPR